MPECTVYGVVFALDKFFNHNKWILQLVFMQTLVNVSVCRGEILNLSSELIMLNWLLYLKTWKLLFCPRNKSNLWGVCKQRGGEL